MLFCKTTTLITAVPSHDMDQGSIRTISLSIKMITPSYKLTSLQLSNKRNIFFKYTGNCSSISHTLICLLHKLKKHYLAQRSFPHLPIRGQRNPVHISHSIYIVITFNICSAVGTANYYICLMSITWPIKSSLVEMIMLMLLKLPSSFNPTDIRNYS